MLYAIRNTIIQQPFSKVYGYISNPENLPKWANAFSSVKDGAALLETPQGQVPIKLKTLTDKDVGNVDWVMTFPDGSEGIAYSRVSPLSDDTMLYSFTLTPPPLPLEELEGVLSQQCSILEKELEELKIILEK
jgi:hypothetical protein|tara:strand:+ start:5836 stop:6234 length:399 start_codon:yes stop_codon:yes gene_type:complete